MFLCAIRIYWFLISISDGVCAVPYCFGCKRVCVFVYPPVRVHFDFFHRILFPEDSIWFEIPITSCVYTKRSIRSSKRAWARAHKSSNNKILIEVFETDSIYFNEFPRPCASRSVALDLHVCVCVCVFLSFYLFIHVFYLLGPPCREWMHTGGSLSFHCRTVGLELASIASIASIHNS